PVGALGGAETRRPAAGRRTDAVARGRSKGLPSDQGAVRRTRSAARLRPRQARRSPSAVSTGPATAWSASADAGPNGNSRAEGGMLPNSGWGFSADIADIVFVAHTSSRIRGL